MTTALFVFGVGLACGFVAAIGLATWSESKKQ